MKKLLKIYGLKYDYQYSDIVLESFINGNRQQAINQFKAMPKAYRKSFLLDLWAKDMPSHFLFFFDIL